MIVLSGVPPFGDKETFKLIRQSDGTHAMQTSRGFFVTAVGGGNLPNEASTSPPQAVLHTDATQAKAWERFKVVPTEDGWYGFQTFAGGFLSGPGPAGLASNGTGVNTHTEYRLYFVGPLSGVGTPSFLR